MRGVPPGACELKLSTTFMKRHIGLFHRIPEWANLEQALALAMRGKKDCAEVRDFISRLPGSLEEIGGRVRRGDGPLGHFREFSIRDPKPRIISAPCFSDRVLHHAVINVCEPVFERWLVRQTFACRRGLGLRAAITETSRWTSSQSWYLQLDVRHYFETVPRSAMFQKLKRLFGDVELLRLWWQLIDSHRTGAACGLPIGCLTSQHLANFYLGFLDRFIKETLRTRGYARYMDDMLLWAGEKQTLLAARDEIVRFVLDELGLELKTPVLNQTRHGLDFLGFRFHRGWVGLARRSRRRLKLRLRRCHEDLAEGRRTELETQQRLTACLAATAPARCARFRQRLVA